MVPHVDVSFMVGIIFAVLWAVSDALGESKRFKANSTLRFICQLFAGACKNVIAQAGPVTKKVLEMAEPIIEHQIEKALEPSVGPVVAPIVAPVVAPPEHHCPAPVQEHGGDVIYPNVDHGAS